MINLEGIDFSSIPPPKNNGILSKRDPYYSDILKWSNEYGIDPNYLSGSLAQESQFNPDATSPTGAGGISQFTGATAKEIAFELGDDDIGFLSGNEIKNFLKQNPNKAIQYSAKYKRKLLDQFDNDERKAIAAYNAGPNAVSKAATKYGDAWLENIREFVPSEEKYNEVVNHVKRVMDYKDKFSSSYSPIDLNGINFDKLGEESQQVQGLEQSQQEEITQEQTQEKTGTLKRLGKAWGRTVLGTQEALGGVVQMTHLPGAQKIGQIIKDDAVNTIKEYYKVDDRNAVDTIAESISSGLLFLVPGLGVAKGARGIAAINAIAKNPKIAANVASALGIGVNAVTESAIEAGSSYNALLEKGISDEEATQRALVSMGTNFAVIVASDALGGMFGRASTDQIRKKASDVAKEIGKGLPKTILSEGIQEGIQETIGQVTEKEDINLKQVGTAAALGGLTAGLIGPIGTISENQQRTTPTPTEQPPVQPEQDQPELDLTNVAQNDAVTAALVDLGYEDLNTVEQQYAKENLAELIPDETIRTEVIKKIEEIDQRDVSVVEESTVEQPQTAQEAPIIPETTETITEQPTESTAPPTQEIPTHTMPDGTVMAGTTHKEVTPEQQLAQKVQEESAQQMEEKTTPPPVEESVLPNMEESTPKKVESQIIEPTEEHNNIAKKLVSDTEDILLQGINPGIITKDKTIQPTIEIRDEITKGNITLPISTTKEEFIKILKKKRDDFYTEASNKLNQVNTQITENSKIVDSFTKEHGKQLISDIINNKNISSIKKQIGEDNYIKLSEAIDNNDKLIKERNDVIKNNPILNKDVKTTRRGEKVKKSSLDKDINKSITNRENRLIGARAAKAKKIAEYYPDIAEITKGMTTEELADYAVKANIASKVELEDATLDTKEKQERVKILDKLVNTYTDYTPELEKKLRSIAGRSFNKIFDIQEGKEGKVILVQDDEAFAKLRGENVKSLDQDKQSKRADRKDTYDADNTALEEEISDEDENLTDEDDDGTRYFKGIVKEGSTKGLEAKEVLKPLMQIVKPLKGKVKVLPKIVVGNHYKKGNTNKTLRNKKGEEAYGAIFKNDNGEIIILINNKMPKEELVPTLLHEMWGHFGVSKVLTGTKNLDLHEYGLALFEKDKNSSLRKRIKEDYAEDIKKDPDVEFDEWIAYNIQEIKDSYFDKDGNFSQSKYDADQSIVKRVFNFIKRIVGRIYDQWTGTPATDREIMDFTKVLIQKFRDISETDVGTIPPRFAKASTPQKNRRTPPKKRSSKEKVRTSINDRLIKYMSAISANDANFKIRWFDFTTKMFYGEGAQSRRNQILDQLKKVKTVKDDEYKKLIKMVDEFVDWQDAKKEFKKTKLLADRVTTDKLGDSDIVRSIQKKLEEITKLYEKFEDYQTLKRLEDRVTVKFREVSKETDKKQSSPKYQRLIDKGFIEKVLKDNDEFYKNTKDGEKYLQDLKTNKNLGLVDDKGNMFNVEKLKDLNIKIADEIVAANIPISDAQKRRKTQNDSLIEKITDKFNEKEDTNLKARSWLRKTREKLKRTRYYTTSNFKNILEILDNYKKGAFTELHTMLRNGFNNEIEFKQSMKDFIKDQFKENNISDEYIKKEYFSNKGEKVELKVGDRVVSLTKDQALMIYMYSKNKEALEHLVDPKDGGFVLDKLDNTKYKFKPTVDEINTIKLNEKDKTIAKILFRYFEKQGVKINEISMEDIGKELAGVTNYLPIITTEDSIQRDERKINSLEETQNFIKAGMPGNLKARTGAKNPLVIEGAFSALGRTAPVIERYIGMALPSRRVEYILDMLKNEFNSKGLEAEFRELKDIVKQITIPGNYNRLSTAQRFFDSLFIPATLGFKLKTAVMQLTAIPLIITQGDTKIMTRALLSGLKSATSNSNKLFEEMIKYSPMLRERYEASVSMDFGENRGLARAKQIVDPKKSKIEKIFSPEFAMSFITKADLMNTIIVWGAAKSEIDQQIKSTSSGIEKGSKEYFKKVAERAEEIIENTQPMFDVLDRPRALGHPLLRSITYFSSAPIKVFQQTVKNLAILTSKNSSAIQRGVALANLAVLQMSQNVLIEVVRLITKSLAGDLDDEEWIDIKKWLAKIAYNNVAMAGIIGTTLASYAFTKYDVKWGAGAGEVIDNFGDTIRATREWALEGKQFGKILKPLDKATNMLIRGKGQAEFWYKWLANRKWEIWGD